ncbi:H+/gluconate symporter-like permease [Saccharopolyspora erythraea NRRL 2338]|uniref:Gluconate permease n=2 Tax=Saccharopolyspora erythraea TaxID=1836 RepID=A4FJ09_SACEN|nr:SLC13 family permease [Saccharopolyspora erythraea]EQD86143.1 gluconate permease [Saccharopolyspora erythraea D]PFG97704.1 H+/gluconate symporter-like permease [Saccharopolyspora erythraea NRRL 2338]QRK87853.1 gluconate permease [Saccharopolyspora erythraea]CAM04034.1 gluconate permease [Saccharopolyspora erythraea NRRL 2338]
MPHSIILLHTAIALVGIIALIVAARLNPVVVLVLGALYLGLATGLGVEGTTEAVTEGFGKLMADVGLIIGFGVLLGSILSATGTLQRIVEVFLRIFGRGKSPYALGLASGVVFPAIYFDVALVMLAPIARSVSRRTGISVAAVGGALAIGLEVGLLMILPGSAALAVSGALGASLGMMLLVGGVVGILSIVISVFLHGKLMRRTWNPAKDEAESDATSLGIAVDEVEEPRRRLPLIVLLIPAIVPLLLIVAGTATEIAGAEIGWVTLLSDPVVALLIGLLLGCGICGYSLSMRAVEQALSRGAATSGTILLFNGVAGSLGEVISRNGVGDIVAGTFHASSFSPLVLAWVVAALLRLAQGSGSVAAITGATLLLPVVGSLGLNPVLVVLAAAAGASFGGHVHDNTFWMFRGLLGLSTRGAFQVYTVAQSIMSIVALLLVLGASAIV